MLSLLADDIILYIKNAKDATPKLLEFINEFRKVQDMTLKYRNLLHFFSFFFFFFLGQHLQHMEVLRPVVKSELQLLAYTTAMVTLDVSCICKLHLGLQQCWILNPLSKARERTQILMDASQTLTQLNCNGISNLLHFYTLTTNYQRN